MAVHILRDAQRREIRHQTYWGDENGLWRVEVEVGFFLFFFSCGMSRKEFYHRTHRGDENALWTVHT